MKKVGRGYYLVFQSSTHVHMWDVVSSYDELPPMCPAVCPQTHAHHYTNLSPSTMPSDVAMLVFEVAPVPNIALVAVSPSSCDIIVVLNFVS